MKFKLQYLTDKGYLLLEAKALDVACLAEIHAKFGQYYSKYRLFKLVDSHWVTANHF